MRRRWFNGLCLPYSPPPPLERRPVATMATPPIAGEIGGNRQQPRTEWTAILELLQLQIGTHERFLGHVLCFHARRGRAEQEVGKAKHRLLVLLHEPLPGSLVVQACTAEKVCFYERCCRCLWFFSLGPRYSGTFHLLYSTPIGPGRFQAGFAIGKRGCWEKSKFASKREPSKWERCI